MNQVLKFFILALSLNNVAHAQTENISGSMDVSTTVVAVCKLELIPSFSFTYDTQITTGASLNRRVPFYHTCTKGTSLTFKVDAGQNYDGSSRNLMDLNEKYGIKYAVRNAVTNVNPDPNTTMLTSTGDGTRKLNNMSIVLLANQHVPAGQYSDTIILTVEY